MADPTKRIAGQSQVFASVLKRFQGLASHKPDRRLITNFGYLGAANLIYALAQWGMLVVTTKLGDVGMTARLSLGLAVAVPVMTLVGAGLRTVITTDVTQRYAFGEYLGTRVLLGGIGLAGILIFAWAARFSQGVLIVAGLIGIIKYFEALQEVCWGISQRHEKMETVGISRTLRGLSAVGGLAAGILIMHRLIPGIIAWGILWAAIFFFYDLPNAQKMESLSLLIVPGRWKAIILQAAPLAVVWGIIALNEKIQYFINWFQGEQAVGYFAPIAFILQGAGMGMAAAGEAMIPRLARRFHGDKHLFRRGGLQLSALGVGIGAAGFFFSLFFGKPFLALVYRPEYAAYSNVFVVIMAVGIIRFAMAGIGNAVTAAGLFKIQIPVFLVVLLVTTIAGFLAVPAWGLVGAALAVGAGFTCGLSLLLGVFIYYGKD